MKIIYSPFFTNHQFAAMPDGQVMMDCSIVDTEQFIALLELHLGIHVEVKNNLDRVVEYYRLLHRYVPAISLALKNIFFGSTDRILSDNLEFRIICVNLRKKFTHYERTR